MNTLIILIFSSIALFTVIWSSVIISRLIKIKQKFNNAIVLIPFYKRSKWPVIGTGILSICFIIAIIYMVISQNYWETAPILLIIISLILVFISMITFKCAVLDNGIVVPYKFIAFTHLYDFHIEDTTIFFCGDKKGFDTITSATTKLNFNEVNKEKLLYILNQRKINR